MKIYLTVATLVASVILMTPSAVQSQAPSAGGTAVAVIDINFIFKNHTRFKASMEDIKKDIETFEAYLRDERTKITTQAERLKTLPAGYADYKELEESIASLHTSLQLETGRKRKDILEREAQIYYNAYKEVERVVENFATRFGIGLVIRFSGEEMDPTNRDSVLKGVNRPVVYNNGLNITGDILNELNRQTPPLPRQAGGSANPQIPVRGARR